MIDDNLIQLDFDGMERVAAELSATPDHVRLAIRRALQRTAATIRKLAAAGLKSELALRNAKLLRTRLKVMKLRTSPDGSGTVRIWIGASDMAVTAFKGRPKREAHGAAFDGRSWPGGFVAKTSKGPDAGRKTVFRRKGAPRLPLIEQGIPVADSMTAYFEDEIMSATS